MSAGEVCAKCGACSVVCPVFRNSGREAHTARGKLHLLEVLGEDAASVDYVDIFSACLLCGACADICARSIDIPGEIVAARNGFSSLAGPHAYKKYLIRKILGQPDILERLSSAGRVFEKLAASGLPENSGLRLLLSPLSPQHSSPASTSAYSSAAACSDDNTLETINWFSGCGGRYLFPDISVSCKGYFSTLGIGLNDPDAAGCCGLADWAAGDKNEALEKARHNIFVFEQTSGPIMVSCASCLAGLQQYPFLLSEDKSWKLRAENFVGRLLEFSELFMAETAEKMVMIGSEAEKIKVYYHQPCHLRFNSHTPDRTEELLTHFEDIELLELVEGQRCCGNGGLFSVAHRDVSETIRNNLVAEVLSLGPDIVITGCSGCLIQWRQGLAAAGVENVKVLHPGQLMLRLTQNSRS